MSKKRGNGEGSISRRKGGGWMGQYTVHTAEGRKRRTVYGKTREEVRQKLTKSMADRDGGLVYTGEGTKLGDYLTGWLRGSEDTIRRSTFARYEQISRVHLRPALGSLKRRNVTPPTSATSTGRSSTRGFPRVRSSTSTSRCTKR